jgi:hypothetical protein
VSIRHPIPVPCACGCGAITKGQSTSGFVTGHRNRGRTSWGRKKPGGFPDGVQIDPEDAIKYGVYRWSLSGNGYVQRHHVIEPCKYTKLRLHREILGFPDGVVDHVNGDKLDCRRCNLRVIDLQGNAQNQRLSQLNTSGHRGVSWNKAQGKWYAHAKVNRKMISLGFFDDLYEAAKVATEYRKTHYKSFIER